MAEGSSRSCPVEDGGGGGGRLVLDDPDVVEVSAEAAAGWGSSGRLNRKRKQVAPLGIIELDADDDLDGVTITGEKTSEHANQQAVGLHMDWPKHAKSGLADDFSGPSAIPYTNVSSWDGLGGFHQNAEGPSAITATNVSPWYGLGGFHQNAAGPGAITATNVSPWNGLGGFNLNAAGPSAIPATNVSPWDVLGGFHQNVAGPSAIPASFFYPWDGLGAYNGGTVAPSVYFDQFSEAPGGDDYAFNKGEYSYNNLPKESGSGFNFDANYYMGGITPGLGAVLPLGHMTSPEMPHQPSQTKIDNSEIDEKYTAFKQFDTVADHSDHFYALPRNGKVYAVKKPSKSWVKRIQHEWKVLEKDLPDTVFVRVYEERMDLLRAVIVGPAGTPYHDGLFFFDVYFPSQYPSKPPLVNYRSGGLRLNPNLYECGKVCLSLLNTWDGNGCEKWNPSKSTMLQVLVSIQALVLNAKPYFNEPFYEEQANTSYGEMMSMAYNEEAFLLSCRTIMYSLHNPPKHFGDFTIGHFRKYGCKLLKGCKAYMTGAQVGCLVGDGVQDVDEGDKSCSINFKISLNNLFVDLQTEFTKIGVDCHELQNPGASKATADTTLRL